MLSSLYIKNLAVIKSTEISFSSGFNVLTGETGAGKSILVDSIGLILGDKPQKELIRSGEEKATVSAVFSDVSVPLLKNKELDVDTDEDGMLYITRTFDVNGKAVTKLGDRTISVSLQKDIAGSLISIHGQNDNRLLMSSVSHLEYLDKYAENGDLVLRYQDVYEQMTECKRKIASLKRDDREKARTLELLKYQVQDIDSAKLKIDEEQQLEALRDKAKNAEKILKHAGLVARALYRGEKTLPAYELIKRSITSLEAISDYVKDSDKYIEKLKAMLYELEDIGVSVLDIADGDSDSNPDNLDKIEARLDLISRMKRKYGSDIEEILEFRRKSAEELKSIELSDEMLETLKFELRELEEKAADLAAELTKRRKNAAEILEKKVISELSYLEMPKVCFKVDITESLTSEGKILFLKSGCDKVEFLLSANQGEPLKPLAKIASGGELSRIMLALRSVSAADIEGETLIFDEIDVGVSGKTSQKIGIRLRRLAEKNQVICVTHAAQIAAEAHSQYLIKKTESDGRVMTTVTELDREGRIKELARIMGGVNITDKIIDSATEMLDNAGKNL